MYPPGFYFSVCAIVDIDMSRTSQSVLSQQYMNSDYSRMYSISQIPLSTASSLPNSFSNYGASRSSYFNLAPSSSSCSEYDGIRHAGSFGNEDTPVVELFFVFHTDRQHRTDVEFCNASNSGTFFLFSNNAATSRQIRLSGANFE